jgi:hypothetical protein
MRGPGIAVKRHPYLILLTAVFVGIVAFVAAYFEPQLLFINKTVHEAPPLARANALSALNKKPARAQDPANAPMTAVAHQTHILSTGHFRSYEHSSHGKAIVLQLIDGERFVRFVNFATSNGPDLRVYLSTTATTVPNADFAHNFVELGHLKGNIGDQNYSISSRVHLLRYQSVVIWCARFDVAFAAAPLLFQ